jgi:transcriptional regulator of arginine metabolism
MKRRRREEIMKIISAKRVATQQELVEELRRRGIEATQSSVSRDIVDLKLTKLDGFYTAPDPALSPDGPVTGIDTAGDNIIVIRTLIGQAQPVAIKIDNAKLSEVVGTVAGDDTIIIAVKNQSAQRAAIRKIIALFASPAKPRVKQSQRATARAPRFF